MISRAHGSVAALLAATMLASCNDGTGPVFAPFDPPRAEADAEALLGAFQSPGTVQFFLAAELIALESDWEAEAMETARALLGPGLPRIGSDGHSSDIAPAGQTLVIGSAPIIPAAVRGITYTYSPGEQRYTPSERPGAPADGVRYVLYAVTPSPQLDFAQEVGYLEIVDLNTAGANTFGLEVRAVSNGTTWFEYTLAVGPSQFGTTIDATGFATNGTTRADFIFLETGIVTGADTTYNIEFQYTVPGRNVGVVGTIVGLGGAEPAQVDVLMSTHRAQVRYVFDMRQTLSGTAYINTELRAQLSGERSPEMLLIQGTTERPLTEAEGHALRSVLLDLLDTHDWTRGLVFPFRPLVPTTP